MFRHILYDPLELKNLLLNFSTFLYSDVDAIIIYLSRTISRPVDPARFDRANDLDMRKNFSLVCQKPCFCPSL